ncbi:MAG: TlpA family protein disulfide reductase [Gammaproteobacteria bacterium]|nr:TlpA family protein disulfide reductase [Gammaproteobacteria bacterium]MBT8134883.1 TlpA family protein disulfide reductase [Gammaproteobacteria bacterium]NNJ50262.1 TlpA family protein disulfide reductase [Gammaproteobacteria bacterium]
MTLNFHNIIRSCLVISALLSVTSSNVHASFDLSLKSIDDSEHKLSEYIGQGKWVVLNIWGTRCPPCREEMPELVSFHDEHNNDDAIVVAVAIDFPSYGYANQDDVIAFAEEYLIDFPVLLSDSRITERAGLGRLQGLPTTYLFNPSGEVVGVQVGMITKNILETFINQLKLKSLQLK